MKKLRFLPLAEMAALFVFATFCNLSAPAAGPGKQNDFQGRRVLIIGIDGCRRDLMEQSIKDGSVPHLAKIAAGGRAFWNMEAGGEPSGERNQPTISGPGWSTLFTGVFANKHGVLGNGEKFVAAILLLTPISSDTCARQSQRPGSVRSWGARGPR